MLRSNTYFRIEELDPNINVLEVSISAMSQEVLNALLRDRTTQKNILWATRDYVHLGVPEFAEFAEIKPRWITAEYATLIRPRVMKSKDAQTDRTRGRAEVFTPSWVCNKQNNLIDAQWFGRENVFNRENGTAWIATEQPVSFRETEHTWKDYVDARRLEIACGEAPYLVSRYDMSTGEKIPLTQRIGLLDRKLRVVKENAVSDEEWLKWSRRAFESVYGYEYQGDNLLLARENLLYTYIEYYFDRFQQMPTERELNDIARVISWNLWQMDGMKYVVPGSCRQQASKQIGFPETTDEEITCPGCRSGNVWGHIGIYSKVMDWRAKRSQTFVSLAKGDGQHGRI